MWMCQTADIKLLCIIQGCTIDIHSTEKPQHLQCAGTLIKRTGATKMLLPRYLQSKHTHTHKLIYTYKLICMSHPLVFENFLGAPWSCFPSWSLPKKAASGKHTSSVRVTWPAKHSCTWSKMDSTLGRQALLRTCSFDMQSSHLMQRIQCKQRWWNRLTSLICFR